MADFAQLGIEITSKGVEAARKRLEKLSGAADTTTTATGKLSSAVKKAAIAFGGLLIIQKLTRMFVAFDTALAEVATISRDIANNMEETAKSLRAFSVYGKGATESAKALYQTISAGITRTSEAFYVLEVASKASVAGLTDTKTAVDILTSALNAYGKSSEEATHISDVLFTTVREGKTTFPELASGLGRAMALASQAGVSFEELSAAVATLTKGGISTDLAVTAVRATIVGLLKPANEASKSASKLGIDFSASALKAKGLGGVLRDVRAAVGGNAEAMAKLFPNVRALAGVMALAGSQAGEFEKQLKNMQETAGATETALKEATDTLSHQAKRAGSSLANLWFILAGGVFKPIVKRWLSGIATAFEAINRGIEQNVIWAKKLIGTYVEQTDIGDRLSKLIEENREKFDAATAAMKKAAEATKSLTYEEGKRALAVEEAITGLENQRRELEHSSREMLNFNLRMADATQEERNRALALFDTIKALKEKTALEQKAFEITREFTTEQERLNQVHQLAYDLRAKNLISQETFNRVIEDTITRMNELKGTNDAVSTTLSTLKGKMESIWVGWSTSFIDKLVEGELAAKDAFKNIAVDFAKMVAKMLLQQAAMKLTARFFPSPQAAQGAAFSNGRVLPFARGGVVTQPTLFPMARGAGLMGEAGPEAVMPLTRTSGGDLGVKAEGLVNVNIINNSGEPITESRRSTAQGTDIDVVIGESVKQHLNRGTLDRAMQSSFGVARRGIKR